MEFKEGMIIHCGTEEKAKMLLKELDKNGYRWSTGFNLVKSNCWWFEGKDTCYSLNEDKKVTYGVLEYFKSSGRTIIEFDDIFILGSNPDCSVNELVKKCLDSVWDYKITEEKPKNEIIFEKQDFIHSDVQKVIKNGNCVIVILNNGSKGISKCHPEDEFSLITGYKIAYNRAKIEDGKLHIKAAESMVRFYGTEF